MSYPINPPRDGFRVTYDRGIPVYSRHPVKVTFKCKCGAKLDCWDDVIEAHKQTDCPLRERKNNG